MRRVKTVDEVHDVFSGLIIKEMPLERVKLIETMLGLKRGEPMIVVAGNMENPSIQKVFYFSAENKLVYRTISLSPSKQKRTLNK